MPPQNFHVRASEKGQTLAAFVKHHLGISWSQARQLIAQRKVRLAGSVCTDDVRRVQTGMEIAIITDQARPKSKHKPAASRAKIAPKSISSVKPSLVYVDEQIVVAEKPAELTTMRHAEEVAEFG